MYIILIDNIISIIAMMHFLHDIYFWLFGFGRFFLFHVLDKVVCPFLVKYFDMSIWHPTYEKSLDLLVAAELDM